MSRITRRMFLQQTAIAAGMTLSSTQADAAGAKRREMVHRAIPASGGHESLPVIGMGTWNTFDVGQSATDRAPLIEVLNAFHAAGAKLIDSSPMYGRAEAVTGDLVAQLHQQGRTFLATKVWVDGLQQGIAQIERSFELLRTKRLDLLQIHNLLDWKTHAATLRGLKDQGRVRYTGITHYTVAAHADLERVLRAEPFDFVQLNYSLATRDAERRLLPYCQEHGIAVLVNRPFEEGELFAQVRGRKLPGYAREIDCTSWAQFFLKYIVSHPAVTCVIPATSRVGHMQDNLEAGFGVMPDAKLRQRMAAELGA
ncbi:MAG TPA: aldo/keto reductase [Povalibacter sp.]|nr:aldo/keto reductase [Povalibacter sp.]